MAIPAMTELAGTIGVVQQPLPQHTKVNSLHYDNQNLVKWYKDRDMYHLVPYLMVPLA